MGYVYDFHDARNYDGWLLKRKNRFAADLESRLMLGMLDPAAGESILDIGCGTGASCLPLLEKGLDVTGIDPSPYMLDILSETLGNRVSLYRGVAEDLPFDDNSFNHACLFTSLEFVDNPQKALEEAFRVAKDRVFIGFLNRYAITGIGRRVRGIFTPTIYNRATFFSVWEIKGMVRKLMGPVPVCWRTVCQLPGPWGTWMKQIEGSGLVQRFPFGTFAGMVVTLLPRFRTRPLAIRYHPKKVGHMAAGTAGCSGMAPSNGFETSHRQSDEKR
ncbi:methyltransferase type 11 [Desulfosarcina ovata subsp. sediminis]|uniref:Methyltransferase type 11 n=1 Tax=Desulfosarcina ovata subsp. sediminis TaxID=885957 RepID=A0A5K7ZU23_9BACT|nr:class I SAM-dependent methyltransferase [Desulfosarcina ovata]BBO83725.1 methyltransferase type 11 [Desulfosarcina ovata subsp. sediminis]